MRTHYKFRVYCWNCHKATIQKIPMGTPIANRVFRCSVCGCFGLQEYPLSTFEFIFTHPVGKK